MDNKKIHELVADKNKDLERYALQSAERIIDSIADCQETIKKANEQIVKLRAQLKELEITQINPAVILGE